MISNPVIPIRNAPAYSKLTNDRTLPAFQRFTILPSTIGQTPQSLGTRQTQGRLSWMATMVPQTDIYAVASGGYSARGLTSSITDEYLLSVGVFANRPA